MSLHNFTTLYQRLGKNDRQFVQGVNDLASQFGAQVFQQLYDFLFQLKLPEETAARYWEETSCLHPPASNHLHHRSALLNYLLFHTDELLDPRVIEASQLAQLQQNAITDGLTGLHNQAFFKQKLDATLQRTQTDPAGVFSLLLFDLDHFKQFNDRCGHLRGDQALNNVGRIISRLVPKDAVAARYGGEEFAVILPGSGQNQAIELAEQIRREVEQTPFPGEERLDRGKLTISGGVACYPVAGRSTVALIAHADSKLYDAKVTRNSISPRPSDSRGIIRHSFRSIVEVRDKTSGRFKSSLSADISYTGLLLKSTLAPQVGSRLELRFHYPFWPSDHNTYGLVRHLRNKDSRNDFLIGIEFEQPQVDFIEQLLPQELYSGAMVK